MSVWVLMAAVLAAEPSAEPREPVIVKPEWVAKPDGWAVNRYFPDLAMRLSVPGRVKLRCDVTATGEVANCQILEETPTGMGFGAAGAGLSQYFRMAATLATGESVAGASVTIPLSFAAPDEDGAIEPTQYRVALGCVTWNRARLEALGDQTTAASLAQAERYARALGKAEGLAPARLDSDIAEAGKDGARERMGANPSTASTCLFLPI